MSWTLRLGRLAVIELLEKIPLFITAANKLDVLDCPEDSAARVSEWSDEEFPIVEGVTKFETGGRIGFRISPEG